MILNEGFHPCRFARVCQCKFGNDLLVGHLFLRNKLRQARLLTKGLLLGELPLKRIDKFFKPLPQSAPHKDFKKHCYITWKSSRLPRSHAKDLAKFIDEMDVPYTDKQILSKLTPSLYIGLAEKLAKDLKDS